MFSEFVGEEFFRGNFWVYWLSMLGNGCWHSALKKKLYMNRFVHHFGGFADLSCVQWTRYNQFESLVLPLLTWLEHHGVTVEYDTRVTDVRFDIGSERTVT